MSRSPKEGLSRRIQNAVNGTLLAGEIFLVTAGGAHAASPDQAAPVPPSPAGLSGDPGKIPGRGFAELALAVTPPSAQSTEKDPNAVSQKTTELRANASRLGGVDAFGYRISNAWKGADGFWYMAYQGGILQQGPNGQVNRWNIADQMHTYGLDTQLNNGSLGVTVPPHQDVNDNSGGDINKAFANRVAMFGIPKNVVDFINNTLGGVQAVGVPTSSMQDYGPYKVVRLQRGAVQVWTDGRIQRILMGDAAKAADLVPADAVVPPQVNEESIPLGGGGPISSSELVNGLFPRDFGNLATDHVVIHNKGAKIGVVDGGGLNNFQALANAAKQFAPNDKFELFFYDDPNKVPSAGPQPYDTTVQWGGENGKQLKVNINGVWQWHVSLPRGIDRNIVDRTLVIGAINFFIGKDQLITQDPPGAANARKTQALDPFNSGSGNYSIKVVG